MHSDFWEKAKQYVSKEARYARSICCGRRRVPDKSLFGARMVDANPKDEVTLKIVTPFGSLKVGDTFHCQFHPQPRDLGAILEVKGGTVIAVRSGQPARARRQLGRFRENAVQRLSFGKLSGKPPGRF